MRFRHSHPFGVERLGTERFGQHSFSHVHECEEGDAHTHVLTAIAYEANFPWLQHNQTRDKREKNQ